MHFCNLIKTFALIFFSFLKVYTVAHVSSSVVTLSSRSVALCYPPSRACFPHPVSPCPGLMLSRACLPIISSHKLLPSDLRQQANKKVGEGGIGWGGKIIALQVRPRNRLLLSYWRSRNAADGYAGVLTDTQGCWRSRRGADGYAGVLRVTQGCWRTMCIHAWWCL